MENQYSHISRLIVAYILGTLSSESEMELKKWLSVSAERRTLFEELCSSSLLQEKMTEKQQADALAAFTQAVIRKKRLLLKRRFLRWGGVAASLLLLVGLFWYYSALDSSVAGDTPPDLAALNTPYLTLQKGDKILLDNEMDVASDLLKSVNVHREKGRMVFTPSSETDSVRFQTLTVPRGNEYELLLEDGTEIRINAGSEIYFPNRFDAAERRIRLSGEAFFKVAANREKPFIVELDGFEVKVYGTEFNVNTHSRGRIETVLLQGEIGVRATESPKEYRVKPGELVSYEIATGQITVEQVKTRLYTAWTEGLFIFEDERLEDVVERLKLWFDLEIVFDDPALKEKGFYGIIRREDKKESVLTALKESAEIELVVIEDIIHIKK